MGHLRPKYGWIQLDLDPKYLPLYIVSNFWVRSSWFQTKNWSTECQKEENCQNRPFWPVLSCHEALTLLDPSGSRLKWPSPIYLSWFLSKNWSIECEIGKTNKIGHFGPFSAVLRPKYGWIQYDQDLKYLPPYIVSDFWLRSSWFQPTAKMGHFELIWGPKIAGSKSRCLAYFRKFETFLSL